MTELEEEKRNFRPYEEKLFNSYGQQLRFDDDKLEVFGEIIDSIQAILEKHDVRAQALHWDQVGVKLQDGKVVLPSGFEETLHEINRDNEIVNLFVPEEMGGFGYTNMMVGPLVDVISSYDMSLQMASLLPVVVMEPLLLNFKQDYEPIIKQLATGASYGYVAFTEPQAGSNLQAINATSEKVGEDYVLNGTKIYITNGGFADTGLFLCKNIVDGKEDGTNVFIVPSLENIDTLRLEKKSGIRASPTAQLHFDNVTVPKEYLVGKVGEGYRKVIERLMGMRASLGFQSTGTAKRAYDLAYDYATTRKQFGKPIIHFKDIQQKLDRMEQQIDRLIDYAYRTGYTLDRHLRGWLASDTGAGGRNMAEKTAAKMVPGIIKEGIAHYFVSGMKIYSTEITNYLVYDAQQIFGGMGFIEESEINKIARDVRILPIYDGTSEIQKWIVSRSQDAIKFIPKFKRVSDEYEDTTMYEDMLFSRYPDLQQLL